jgi:hypothetical protein
MIGEYIGDDDDGYDSSSTDNYTSKSEEEVTSEEEEMNLLIGSEEELLIQRGRYDDGDTSDLEKMAPSEMARKPLMTGTPPTMKKISSPTTGASLIR